MSKPPHVCCDEAWHTDCLRMIRVQRNVIETQRYLSECVCKELAAMRIELGSVVMYPSTESMGRPVDRIQSLFLLKTAELMEIEKKAKMLDVKLTELMARDPLHTKLPPLN